MKTMGSGAAHCLRKETLMKQVELSEQRVIALEVIAREKAIAREEK